MKKFLGIIGVLIIVFSLSGCGKSSFDGSRIGNDSQFVMEYRIFNTTDEQSLLLDAGDTIRAKAVVDSGRLSIKIQKDSDAPIYENDNIVTSESFDVEIQESGTYKITVTGEKTKGSVSFEKVAGEETERNEVQQEVSEKTIDLSEAFQDINGCAVIYSPVQENIYFLMKICVDKKNHLILLLRLFQLYQDYKMVLLLMKHPQWNMTERTMEI